MDESMLKLPITMFLELYRGGVGNFWDLVVIFSTLVRILVTMMSCPIFSPRGPFVGANTH